MIETVAARCSAMSPVLTLKRPPAFFYFILKSCVVALLWALCQLQRSAVVGCSSETILSRSFDPSTLVPGKRCE